MSSTDTREIIRELYDAYGRHDFEALARLIHEDIDWIIFGPISVFPFAGARRGRAAVLKAIGDIQRVYALEGYLLELVIVDGDTAAVMSDVSFRQRTTNRMLRFRVANFMRLRDGQLVEFREFANTFDVVEQVLGRELTI